MEEGRALARKIEQQRERKPRVIAGRIAVAVVMIMAWLLRGLVLGPLLVAWSEFRIEVEKTRQPDHWVKPRVFPPAPVSSAPAQVAVSSFVYLTAGTPPSQPAFEAPPAPEPEPAPRKIDLAVPTPISVPSRHRDVEQSLYPGELRVHGTVYDLETGQPVREIVVRFQQTRSDTKWETMTNAAGHYQVGLYKNPSDAVTVTIEAAGYRKGLLEDREPPYRERSAQARAGIMAETTESDLEPVPLRYKESARIVELDLVLVPLAKK